MQRAFIHFSSMSLHSLKAQTNEILNIAAAFIGKSSLIFIYETKSKILGISVKKEHITLDLLKYTFNTKLKDILRYN